MDLFVVSVQFNEREDKEEEEWKIKKMETLIIRLESIQLIVIGLSQSFLSVCPQSSVVTLRSV